MKTTHLLYLTLFLLPNLLYGQDNFIIEFDQIKPIDEVNFNCKRVIDLRNDTLALGIILQKGERLKATFDTTFEDKLEVTFSQLLPSEKQVPELVIGVHTLLIREEQHDFNQVGYCDIELEFFKEVDNELYSLGIYQHKTIQSKTDVTKSHKKRIIKTLKKCIKTLQDSKKLDSKGLLITEQELYLNGLSKTNTPPDGIYFSLGALIRQSPSISFDGKMYQKNLSKKAKTYFIELGEKEILNTSIQYISNKGTLYMMVYKDKDIDKNILIEVKQIGRFLYFEDKSSNPQLSFLLGLTGAALSRKLRGHILDTRKKLLSLLNDYVIYQLTKEHQSIFKTYKASRRKIKDKENVIIELNKFFEENVPTNNE